MFTVKEKLLINTNGLMRKFEKTNHNMGRQSVIGIAPDCKSGSY